MLTVFQHPVTSRLEPGMIELLDRFGFELVDLQYLHASGAWVLRVFVDHAQTPRFQPYGGGPVLTPGAITVADCENVSRILSAWLDEQDAIPRSYHLEVSSPGLDRVLRKESDFERFRGMRCRVKTIEPVGSARAFRGTIEAAREGTLFLVPEGATESVVIALTNIEKANLDPDLPFGQKKHKER